MTTFDLRLLLAPVYMELRPLMQAEVSCDIVQAGPEEVQKDRPKGAPRNLRFYFVQHPIRKGEKELKIYFHLTGETATVLDDDMNPNPTQSGISLPMLGKYLRAQAKLPPPPPEPYVRRIIAV